MEKLERGNVCCDLLLIQDLIVKIILFPFWRVLKTFAVQSNYRK
jgi:hypothetical protein